MSSLQNRIVALLLTVLYAFMGVMGQSAHYCLERLFSSENLVVGQKAHGSQGTVKVYFHRHGDDQHWHYHQVIEAEPALQEKNESRRPTLNAKTSTHSEHACPLLSVLRILEQGSGGQAFLSPQLTCATQLLTTEQSTYRNCALSEHLARGPPLRVLA